jgi:hypothetical protein
MPDPDPDPDIKVSANRFDPSEFNAGGPGTSVSFQAADQGVPFYAQEGLFYIKGKCGETNKSTTRFDAPPWPGTLTLIVAAGIPAAYALCNSSPCSTGGTGKIHVGMFVSASGFSPALSDVDAGASVVFQSQDPNSVKFIAEKGLFDTEGPTEHCAPPAPHVRLLPVLQSAARPLKPYKLMISGNPSGTGDGEINVGSGTGGGHGDHEHDHD